MHAQMLHRFGTVNRQLLVSVLGVLRCAAAARVMAGLRPIPPRGVRLDLLVTHHRQCDPDRHAHREKDTEQAIHDCACPSATRRG